MDLDAYCYGYAGFSKSAIFSIMFDDGVSRSYRTVPVATKSAYNAELYAIKFAMLSVADPSKVELHVYVTMKHIPSFFIRSDMGWSKKSTSDTVTWVRDYSAKFARFGCHIVDNADDLATLKSIAKNSDVK